MPKSSISPLARRIQSELTKAGTRLEAVLQSERKFRPLLKKATRSDKHALSAHVKRLKRKYQQLLNLVGF